MGLEFDLTRMEGSPGYLLNQACSNIKLALTRTFRDNGYKITHEHWTIMRALWDEERLTQTQLARKTEKDRPNITRILDVLEKNGYAQRAESPDDRRVQYITLTDKGKEIRNRITALALDLLQEVFANVSQKEYDCFASVLARITDNMMNSKQSNRV